MACGSCVGASRGCDGRMVAGGAVSCCVVVVFLSIGLPVIVTGALLMAFYPYGGLVWIIGLCLVLLAALVLLAGLGIVVILYSACCCCATRATPVQPTVHVVTVQPTVQDTALPMQPPSYDKAMNPSSYQDPEAGISQLSGPIKAPIH